MFNRLAILVLLGASLVCAKNYTFTVFEPSQIGKVQVKAGDYTLKVDGTQVVLMDPKGKQIDTPAKVETVDKKFRGTGAAISKDEGGTHVNWVGLGGSNTRVVFE